MTAPVKDLRQLPNGDLWRPNYGDGSENASADPAKGATGGMEKVEDVVRASRECPWCGRKFEGEGAKVAMKSHITRQHSESVRPESEARDQASKAMARRAPTGSRTD